MDERFLATAAVALALGGVFGSGSSRIAEVQPSEPLTSVNAAADAATLANTTSQSTQAPEHDAPDPWQMHAVSQAHAVKQVPAGKQWPPAKHAPVIWQEADAMDQASLVPLLSGTLDSEGAR